MGLIFFDRNIIKHRSFVAAPVLTLIFATALLPGIALASSTWTAFPAQEPGREILMQKLVFSEPRITELGERSIIEIPGCNYTTDAGMPEVPMKILVYKLPFGSSAISVELRSAEWNTMSISKPLKLAPQPVPVIPPGMKVTYNPPPTPAVPDVYPENPVELVTGAGLDPQTMTRVTYAAAHVYPVKCLPGNQVEYMTGGEVVLRYVPGNIKFHSSSIYQLLIISPDAYKANYDDLAAHKISLGMSTKVVTLTEIYTSVYFPVQGRDPQEKIKYFIKDAIENWSINYTVLGADADTCPFRMARVPDGIDDDGAEHGDGMDVPSDLYFADIYNSTGGFCSWDDDKNGLYGENYTDFPDFIPDVFVGRLPANSTADAQFLVDRIKYYEENTYGAPWFKTALLVGCDTFPGSMQGIPEGEYENEHLQQNYLTNFTCVKLYETKKYAKDYNLTRENLTACIDNGAGLIHFSDHGTYRRIMFTQVGTESLEQLNSSDVDNFTNGNELPVVFADACLTAGFDNYGHYWQVFGERWLFAKGGGAIAYEGCTRLNWLGYDTSQITQMNGYLSVQFWKAFHDGTDNPGGCLAQAWTDYKLQFDPIT